MNCYNTSNRQGREMNNIFIPNQDNPEEEQFDTLLQIPNIHIEKITSYGQTSDQWYEQEDDEWVVLIEGEGHLLFKDGSKVKLKKGEHIHIPKMKRHKVIYTSSPAIWLAIHFKTEQ
jgi:cupin 2 domain-containing protein